jgi:sugar (pentulose or hexulose) kinase
VGLSGRITEMTGNLRARTRLFSTGTLKIPVEIKEIHNALMKTTSPKTQPFEIQREAAGPAMFPSGTPVYGATIDRCAFFLCAHALSLRSGPAPRYTAG